jgi:hypothetical protein
MRLRILIAAQHSRAVDIKPLRPRWVRHSRSSHTAANHSATLCVGAVGHCRGDSSNEQAEQPDIPEARRSAGFLFTWSLRVYCL